MKHGRNGYTNRGCRCDECRAAQAAYMRDYYKTHKDDHQRANRHRSAALLALKRNHPDEYRDLLNAERAADGIAPVGSVPMGPRRDTA